MFQKLADFYLKYKQSPDKKNLLKQICDNAYFWASETVPYFTLLYFKSIFNGAKRMGYKGTIREMTGEMDSGDATFIDNWWVIAIQSFLIPLALLGGIFFQLNYALNKLIMPALAALKKLFKNYPRISLGISVSNSFGILSGLILSIFLIFVLPSVILQMLNVFILGALLTSVFTPLVLYGLFSLKLFDGEIPPSQNQSPFIGHKNVLTLVMSTFFTWVTPNNINLLFSKIGVFFAKHTVLFSAKNIFDDIWFIFRPERRKEALVNSITELLQEGRKFIDDYFYIKIDEDLFDLLKNYIIFNVLENMNQIENQRQADEPNLFQEFAEKIGAHSKNNPKHKENWLSDFLKTSNNYFSQFVPKPMPEPSAPSLDALPRDILGEKGRPSTS